MATKDYYDVLEIPADATQEQIKKQYRLLLHAWHPDKFPIPDQKTLANQKTKEINEAYEVISDPIKRAVYDKQRSGQPEASPTGSYQTPYTRPQPGPTATAGSTQHTQRKADDERQRRFEEAARYQAAQRQREEAEIARRAEQEWRQRRNIILAAVVVFVVIFVLANNGFLKGLFGNSVGNPANVLAPTTWTDTSTSVPSVAPTVVADLEIAVGETRSMSIGSKAELRLTLRVDQANHIAIRVTADNPGSLETSLDVFDTQSRLLAHDEDSGGNLNPYIANLFVRPNTTYTIVIRASSAGGTFTISVQKND